MSTRPAGLHRRRPGSIAGAGGCASKDERRAIGVLCGVRSHADVVDVHVVPHAREHSTPCCHLGPRRSRPGGPNCAVDQNLTRRKARTRVPGSASAHEQAVSVDSSGTVPAGRGTVFVAPRRRVRPDRRAPCGRTSGSPQLQLALTPIARWNTLPRSCFAGPAALGLHSANSAFAAERQPRQPSGIWPLSAR